MFSFGLKLKESIIEIAKAIEKELFKALQKYFGIDFYKLTSELLIDIKRIIKKNIEDHPTFISMLHGDLLPELGLPPDTKEWAATNMLDLIVDGLDIKVTPSQVISGTAIDLHIIWTNDKIMELVFRGEGIYISYGRGVDGALRPVSVPWLEWLLTEGTAEVVSTHHIEFGDFTRQGSRTGLALMKRPGTWHMPEKYAGTINDNFITQAIASSKHEIEQFLVSKFS
jgi:hypothetical protein